MFSLRVFAKHIRFLNCRLHYGIFRALSIYEQNFEFFRNKNDYKNSLVHLNSDLAECKVAGPRFSFLVKGQDAQNDGFFFHLMNRDNVMKLSAAQIKDIMCLMANTKIDVAKYTNALKYIDEKCALSVERWPLDLSLYILDAWLIILGPKAFKKYYYSAITSMWSKKMKRCSKCNLILILHFIGMSKTSPPFLMELLEDKLESFTSALTDEEWSIACLSFFKTSTRINSDLLLQGASKAAENLIVKKDHFHLISILKCLRLSRYNDVNLRSNLIEFIKKEYSSFNFVECTNFLASFATQNIYDVDVYNCLEKQGISVILQENPMEFDKNVEKMHPSERTRVKDLARYLWGMAVVGHHMQEESVLYIIHVLKERLTSGEFETNLPVLIDCLQSLILLNHYPQNLIEYVSSLSFKQKISTIEKAKPKYQLYFIYRSAFIENSITGASNIKFLNHIPRNLEKDIKERKGFLDLIDFLNNTSIENAFTCCYVMPHIMIAGIVISTKSKGKALDNLVYNTLLKYIDAGIISKHVRDILCADKFFTCIEILDPTVCVNGSSEPFALMKTKILQLQKLNMDVITLTPEEISLLKKSNGPQNCLKIANIIS